MCVIDNFSLIQNSCKDETFQEMLEVLKYSHDAASAFWRAVYAGGMWISREEACTCVTNGWRLVAPRPVSYG